MPRSQRGKPSTRATAIAISAALLIGVIAGPSIASAMVGVTFEQNVSRTSDQSEFPSIAGTNGRLTAVWGERKHKQVGFSAAWQGNALDAPTLLDTNTNSVAQWPSVAVDGNGTSHISYGSGNSIFYRSRTSDGGWSQPILIAGGKQPGQTRITTSPDGTLWVVWRNIDGEAIYYRFSKDNGHTWVAGGDGGVVEKEEGNMIFPSIAADKDSRLHVVWYVRNPGTHQGDIRYADWDGAQFRSGSIAKDGNKNYNADPSILIDSQNVQHVVWRRGVGANEKIMYARRPEGQSWQSVTTLVSNLGDLKFAPAIGTDEQNNLYVTYSEPTSPKTRHIVLLFKAYGQKGWESIPVSSGPWDTRSAVVGSAVQGGIKAHVVYQHEVKIDDGEIMYSRVLINGQDQASAPAAPAAPSAPAPSGSAFSPAERKADCTFMDATQHNMCGSFRSYWQKFGGVGVYGLPISEEFAENGVTIQYYERARLEYHPGTQPSRYDVQLGWLGSELSYARKAGGEAAFQDAQPAGRADCSYVPETKHNMCGSFRSYWQQFGDIQLYGNPISEELQENGLTVQYYERARLEYHPGEQPQRYSILLGLVGSERAAQYGR